MIVGKTKSIRLGKRLGIRWHYRTASYDYHWEVYYIFKNRNMIGTVTLCVHNGLLTVELDGHDKLRFYGVCDAFRYIKNNA